MQASLDFAVARLAEYEKAQLQIRRFVEVGHTFGAIFLSEP